MAPVYGRPGEGESGATTVGVRFHPGAHQSQIVIEQLKERKAEAPVPGADANDDQKQ